MKRLLKSILRPFWRLSARVRRPIMAKLAERQRQVVLGVVQSEVHPHLAAIATELYRIYGGQREQFAAIEHAINVTRCTHDALTAETNLALDGLVRELARLQRQVEVLQDAVEDLNAARDGLALVAPPDQDAA